LEEFVMTEHQISTLNGLLRGELAATETYEQAITKFDGAFGASELRRLHDEHSEAAEILRLQIRELGSQPPPGSGLWGGFAKAVEGMAKVFGGSVALRVLREGEKSGVRLYENALYEPDLPQSSRELIHFTLLPRTRAHIAALDGLMRTQQ
jgi:Domain of unknown function (DUF2383)